MFGLWLVVQGVSKFYIGLCVLSWRENHIPLLIALPPLGVYNGK
jgi:hypothetical protein